MSVENGYEKRAPFVVQWFAALVLGFLLGVLALLLVWSKPASAAENCVTNPSATVTAGEEEKEPTGEDAEWPALWVSRDEVMELPTSGAAWDRVRAWGYADWGSAELGSLTSSHDAKVWAGALVGVRLGDEKLLTRVRGELRTVVQQTSFERTLEPSRNLVMYLAAADLLRGDDEELDDLMAAWARLMLEKELDGHSGGWDIPSTHKRSMNNHGTMAGGAHLALAVYLRDDQAVRNGWSFFQRYVSGGGIAADGGLPEELRRDDPYGYSWEGLQGAVVQAVMLHRQGFDAFSAGERALLRAANYLHGREWPAVGDDRGLVYILRSAYGEDLEQELPSSDWWGKNNAWSGWLFG